MANKEKKELNKDYSNVSGGSGGMFISLKDYNEKKKENGGTFSDDDILDIAQERVTYRCSECGVEVPKFVYVSSYTHRSTPPVCPNCHTWTYMERI